MQRALNWAGCGVWRWIRLPRALSSGSALSTFGAQPAGLAVSPNGGSLYFATRDTGTLGIGTLDAAGDIVYDTVIPTWRNGFPSTLHLRRRRSVWLDVLDTASGRIETFQLGAGGTPTSLGVTFASSGRPAPAHLPNGRFLYAPSLTGTLYGFAINATTGALTPVPGSPFATGNVNVAVAIVQPTP